MPAAPRAAWPEASGTESRRPSVQWMTNMPSDISQMPIREFLSAVAAKVPVPGAGAAAAIAGAAAAALAEKPLGVTRPSENSPGHPSSSPLPQTNLGEIRIRLQDLATAAERAAWRARAQRSLSFGHRIGLVAKILRAT